MMFSLALLHPADTFSWTEWRVYPDFFAGWLILFGGYLLCVGPLRDRFQGSEPVGRWRLASFSFGMLLMLVGLQGPLHQLSDNFLFSAHMIQHLLVMLVMPPFLIYGTPGWLLRPVLLLPGIRSVVSLLTHPIVAFLVINGIFIFWHFPAPYDLMMRDHTVHKLMHLMIMGTGVLMYWPVMSTVPEFPRVPPPLQMIYLFVLGIPMMATAAMITFAEGPIYTWYTEAPRIFSLSALEDEKLGALIMWIPGALVTWIGITAVYFRWTRRELQDDERQLELGLKGQGGIVIVPPPYPDR